MKATEFEYRHRTLLHLTAVAIAFLSYLVNRDDIVWALVRGHSEARLLERAAFTIATVLIGVGTALRTWGRIHAFAGASSQHGAVFLKKSFLRLRYTMHIGTLLFAVGLGFLAPLPGFIFLVMAEAILVIRLIVRDEAAVTEGLSRSLIPKGNGSSGIWPVAVRLESGKWGLFFTMAVFTLLLNDRAAEVLAAGSFLLWISLNYRSCHSAIAS